ncbi:hypothetical protein KEJ19_06175, partial [Candidatus Bathyarchaeota archaeon]|nr:hypothetical protein [Candidatus Bathyarchaeota archaeon]
WKPCLYPGIRIQPPKSPSNPRDPTNRMVGLSCQYLLAPISTIQKRVKAPLDIGNYQRRVLEDTKPTHAILAYRDKTFSLHITVSREIPEPKGNNPIGVDVGMKNFSSPLTASRLRAGKSSVKGIV